MENVDTKCSDVNPKVNRLRQNASEKNIEAKAYYFSATAGAQANKIPTQTLENAFKGNDKLKQTVDHFWHWEKCFRRIIKPNQRGKSNQYK